MNWYKSIHDDWDMDFLNWNPFRKILKKLGRMIHPDRSEKWEKSGETDG